MKPRSRVWELAAWHTPASDYPETQLRRARIRRHLYRRGYYNHWGLDGNIYFKVKKPIGITVLETLEFRKWRRWMVDDPPQYRAMQLFAEAAHGRVLTTGLGLGLVVHELLKNPKVKGTTVVEVNQDVIDLVVPVLPPGPWRVLHDDFGLFVRRTGEQFDTIIVDLWVTGDVEEKIGLLVREVMPLDLLLRRKWPKATISYHGFLGQSDVKLVSPDTMELIAQMRR